MRSAGELYSISKALDGSLLATFKIADEFSLKELESLKGEALIVEAHKPSNKRSIDANRYMWQLVDKIAKKLHTNKDIVYLMYIIQSGVFVDLYVKEEAIPQLENTFRYVQRMGEGEKLAWVRCFWGSHNYDTKQMADLIDAVVDDAKELGIETLTPDELTRLKEMWK